MARLSVDIGARQVLLETCQVLCIIESRVSCQSFF